MNEKLTKNCSTPFYLSGSAPRNVVQLGFETDAFQRQKEHGGADVGNPGYEFPGAPLDTYAPTFSQAHRSSCCVVWARLAWCP